MKAALRNQEDGGWLRRGLDTPGWGSGQMGVSWVLAVGRSGPQTRAAAPSRHLTDRGRWGGPSCPGPAWILTPSRSAWAWGSARV